MLQQLYLRFTLESLVLSGDSSILPDIVFHSRLVHEQTGAMKLRASAMTCAVKGSCRHLRLAHGNLKGPCPFPSENGESRPKARGEQTAVSMQYLATNTWRVIGGGQVPTLSRPHRMAWVVQLW
jgi:hypothetical protein